MSKPKTVRKIEKADRALARETAATRKHAAVHRGAQLSEWADQPPVAALCLGVVAAGALAGDRKLLRTGLRMGAAFALATLTKAVVKASVDRTRPAVARARGYASGKGRRNDGPWNSFPSGHTANAVALAGAVAREYPALAWPAAAVAGVTGAAQLPREAHYASDVLAGAIIGVATEAATARLFD